jgi:hypothetical protein
MNTYIPDTMTSHKDDGQHRKFHKMKRYPTYKDGKQTSGMFTIRRQPEDIIVYTTRTSPDAKIRHAMYGTFFSDRVGSMEEYKYFKVALATGELDCNTNHLYYDSPEEYEQHFGCTLSSSSKHAWKERNGIYDDIPIQEEDHHSQSISSSVYGEYEDPYDQHSYLTEGDMEW